MDYFIVMPVGGGYAADELPLSIQKFLTGVFVRPCLGTHHDGRQRRSSGNDGIDLVDSVVLWLFCHTTKGGPGHTKLLAER